MLATAARGAGKLVISNGTAYRVVGLVAKQEASWRQTFPAARAADHYRLCTLFSRPHSGVPDSIAVNHTQSVPNEVQDHRTGEISGPVGLQERIEAARFAIDLV